MASCCRLTVRIEEGTSSLEHKFKVVALLLAQAMPSNNWQPPGTKVDAGSALDMMHLNMKDLSLAKDGAKAGRRHTGSSGKGRGKGKAGSSGGKGRGRAERTHGP